MSGKVIPGYDFSTHEEVTGDKFLKYASNLYVDAANPITVGAFTLMTGASLPSSAAEGSLALDMGTGKICVYGRWGWVPLFGGGFFTARSRRDVWDGYSRMPFFTAFCALGSFKATPLSLSGIADARSPDWNAFVPLHSKRYGQDGSLEIAPAVLWPSPANNAPADTSELTGVTNLHRLLCLRGFSPIRSTIVTSYTSYYCQPAGAGWGFQFRKENSEYLQAQIDWPVWSIAHTYTQRLGGTSITNALYMAYIKPRLHLSSAIGVPYMNAGC